MTAIVDENMSPTIAEFLTARGHRALHVRDIQQLGASDDELMAIAENMGSGAVILTQNVRDFAPFIQRIMPPRATPRLRRCGLIGFACAAPLIRQRLEETIELIESELEIRQKMPNKQLIVRVEDNWVCISR
ncbi:MAG: DUF5615 family PIN-like protein [Myxococcales bacterium]|nr:DUF5615 family PIN-like protein [Myxococcales bacterium]